MNGTAVQGGLRILGNPSAFLLPSAPHDLTLFQKKSPDSFFLAWQAGVGLGGGLDVEVLGAEGHREKKA